MLAVPHRLRRNAVLALAAVTLCTAPGCSTTRMTNMWVDKDFMSAPMRNVLVIAVRKDPARQRLWEDAFVAELTARGAKAMASYRVFATQPDTLQVVQAVREHGYDGVMVSARLDPATDRRYVPGYTTTQPETRFSHLTGRYETYYRQTTTPGYVETTTTQRFETHVWTTGERGNLVWSGVLECTDAVDADAIRDGVSKRIVPELALAGIVPPLPGKN